MADIDVQRKGPSIWPWIIGLLVLALLIWAVAEMVDTDEPEVAGIEEVTEEPAAIPAPVTEPTEGALPAPVQSYMTECTEQMGPPPGDMGREHEFTVSCLQHIGNALDGIIEQDQLADVNVSQRLDSYRNTVQELRQSDPSATDHANLTREAALEATTVMDAARQAWFTREVDLESEVSQARQAAEQIEPTTVMLEQRDDVRNFFRETGDALRAMAQVQPAGTAGQQPAAGQR